MYVQLTYSQDEVPAKKPGMVQFRTNVTYSAVCSHLGTAGFCWTPGRDADVLATPFANPALGLATLQGWFPPAQYGVITRVTGVIKTTRASPIQSSSETSDDWPIIWAVIVVSSVLAVLLVVIFVKWYTTPPPTHLQPLDLSNGGRERFSDALHQSKGTGVRFFGVGRRRDVMHRNV